LEEYLELCSDVITKRQNPNRVADVFNICCEVVFGILYFKFSYELFTISDSLLV